MADEAVPVPCPIIPVVAERGGTQLQTPRATVVVDTREQKPFNFVCFKGWFGGIEKRALSLGDYSVAGLEDVCVIERKDLTDLVHSCTAERASFSSAFASWLGIHIGCWWSPAR